MGWNFVLQSATHNRVIAVTRKNNKPHIEKYQSANPDERYSNIEFRYFDWPKWMIFWKKGPILSLIYYYFWQLTLALHIRRNKWKFEIAHNLNFHNDWTPSFLWMTGKPLIWGPVGHHPKIKAEHIQFYGRKAILADRLLWTLKLIFWNLDPFLYITKKKACHVFCMNEEAAKVLGLSEEKYSIMPSVATEDAYMPNVSKEGFTIISAGRFVPLKGFDITIESFAKFYHSLPENNRSNVRLNLVGSGPFESQLKDLAQKLDLGSAIIFTSWIKRDDLQRLYASSSAFLFPSYEGAGMVVAEAMSHSLPVICWNNCGPGEFVPGASELKVDLTNTREQAIDLFAEKLSSLFTDKALFDSESKMARSRFETHFAWESRGEKLASIYQQTPTCMFARHRKLALELSLDK
jgi:glycosyltransferase involved in cell wall biosynthesis